MRRLNIRSNSALPVLFLSLAMVLLSCGIAEQEDEQKTLVYYTFSEPQCYGSPWTKSNDLSTWENNAWLFLEEMGIQVYSIEAYTVSGGFCAACGCPTGRYIEVQIDEGDAEYIESFGFQPSAEETPA